MTPYALEQLKGYPKADPQRPMAALQDIADCHPRRLSCVTELGGRDGAWRARKGKFRAVLRMTTTTMTVIAVRQRKDVCE